MHKRFHYQIFILVISIFFILPANVRAEDFDYRNTYDYNMYGQDVASNGMPENVKFPVVLYLSQIPGSHPSLKDRLSITDVHVDTTNYAGYLEINKYNYKFVNKATPGSDLYNGLESISILNPRSHENKICGEFYAVCAPNNTWAAAWVALAELNHYGIFISAYTLGEAGDDAFVPQYQRGQHLSFYPEFSNPNPDMKTFAIQGFGSVAMSDWWSKVGEKIKVDAQKSVYDYFPMNFYVALSARGLAKALPHESDSDLQKEHSVPEYVGYITVTEDYEYSFTNKSPYRLSIQDIVSEANQLDKNSMIEAKMIFDVSFEAQAHSWAGLGVLLSKIMSTGDYFICGYSDDGMVFEVEDFEYYNRRPWNLSEAKYPLANMSNEQQAHGDDRMKEFSGSIFFNVLWPNKWSSNYNLSSINY